ncbi:hypothetical protein A3I40_00910 [Candidatus Uhrbacteria bacterium RIFCSPLOWO2_02_FULL_48_12]|uniref:Septum formation initiator n=1 Tax=Candidatus Uhrbacteria bacterium RIFCSPLOWO2_02_FULL_48_12 TaxID=1802407 RepID=A0A1F7VAI9_9BACT|nr:MAG: hypothetical protein A3I40_00910 [Candidatus Uhrbacteria bacterium RIFCSPLOWO2_02_FULL_48_12]
MIAGRVGDIRSWIPWLLGILIAVLSMAVAKQAVKWYSIQEQVESYERELASVESRRQELQELIKYVQTPSYTEEQARLKFGLAKPGERLAVIPENLSSSLNDSNNNSQIAGSESKMSGAKSNYQKWWLYFFDQ